MLLSTIQQVIAIGMRFFFQQMTFHFAAGYFLLIAKSSRIFHGILIKYLGCFPLTNTPPLISNIFVFRGKKTQPILVQVARQVVKLNPADLRLPSRAWKVKLLGEGADDAGGVFDDTITEMCQVSSLTLLEDCSHH